HIDTGYLAGKEDTIKAVIDYSSKHVQGLAAAMQRAQDTICVEAFFAARRTGKDGLTASAYVADADVNLVPKDFVLEGAAANSGMTFGKILRGWMLLTDNEVDTEMEKLYLGLTTREMQDLFTDLQFLSKDFRDKADVDQVQRMVTGFMGIEFVRYKNLPMISATERRCPMWAQSGMHYGEPMPLETSMMRDPTKKMRLRTYMEMYVGATRSDDKKVIDLRTYHA
ncbi:MAG TPA: phage capsid protein, partial [Hyphomicrobiales bacterium]|nr:phage capsid protein [Hyphomicrobiales bacterium]